VKELVRIRIAALALIALLLAAGCGADKDTSSATGGTTANTQATFVLTEFKIGLDGTIPAGPVNVKIDNQGGEKHELVIVSAKDANALSKKSDGSVDEDKVTEGAKLGESGDVATQSSMTKTFTFKPGTYVAFCNLVDDMGMTGTTMMNGGDMHMGGNGQMGGSSNSTAMGGNSATGGHVHFAQGMYMTFTVK
jgi:plastocyanin